MRVGVTPLPFEEAKRFTIGFGKHRGRTLDDIASSDDGLLYLDWLLSTDRPLNRLDYWTSAALQGYLGDAAIAKDLEAILAARKRP